VDVMSSIPCPRAAPPQIADHVEHTNRLRAIWMQFNGFAAQPVRITIPSAANSAMRIKPESPSCTRIALPLPVMSKRCAMRQRGRI
jgi:hypothetical protein